ncbi:cobalamin-binding protein [Alteromonas sp. 14N.309.X.WAT.G.H12]|uniref:cobalamin-binding protein n=1 Tax=Alteromonas sp. 14N.309.X.WAT.G.H12 TaxID=3120824 RepID=UPI002FD5A2A8
MSRVYRLTFALVAALCCSFSQAQDIPDEDKQRRRLVVLAPHLVESMFAIGAGDQIVATTAHSDYPEQAKSIPQIGNYARLQIEKILQLRPDIVVAWRTGNPADDLLRLEKYNMPVVYTQPTELNDVANEIILLGELTGREDKAQTVANAYLTRLRQIEDQYQHKPPVTVFYELWSRPLRTVAGNSWLQQQISACGGRNIYVDMQEDYPQVSLEDVLAKQPQVIIQPSKHGQSQPDAVKWQTWPQIPAVNNHFILHPNADKVHRMTTRMLDELEKMCQDIDQARQFYQTAQ